MAPPDDSSARYQMGPRSTRGLIAGWRSGQIACVAVGLALAVGVLRSIGGVDGGMLALLIVGGAVAAATWPIGGRSVEQWAPTAAAFASRAIAEGRYRPWQSPRAARGGSIARLSLFQLSETEIGVIGDAEAGTWSAVVPVDGAGFALLDDAERAARVAAWSGVLAAMSREGSGLHRVQWVARSYPAYLDGPPHPECSDLSGSSGESYSQLVGEVVPELWAQEVLIAVTVRAGPRSFSARATAPGRRKDSEPAGRKAPASARRQARASARRQAREEDWSDHDRPVSAHVPAHARRSQASGGPERSGRPEHLGHPKAASEPDRVARVGGRGYRRSGHDPALLLRRQLASLAERLHGAGLGPGSPFTPAQLAASLRRSFEVSALNDVVIWPWPVGVAEAWTRLQTDATWQAVYWIAEWPRTEVGTTWMLPLLLSTGIRRTVSVTMAPLPPLTAVRRAERERTSGIADVELRQRHGFAISARVRREQDSRLQREAELADGHAGYRYSGYVTVTGQDVDDLEQSCTRVEQVAALAQLELRRLYGAQEQAFCCSLPIGRGCR